MNEAAEYWLKSSQDDLDTAQKLFNLKKYNHALFFLHLTLEKIIKGVYLLKKNEAPPLIHDLVILAEKAEIETSQIKKEELVEISTFNIAARYDDYKLKFYKKATKEYSQKWFKNGEKLFNKFKELIK